jgi:hypothetical protein
MNIVKATRQFEDWLGRRTDLVTRDLRLKHTHMKEAIFPFFRATFYRWAQLWPKICPDLAKAPHVLAVGDLHVENFGTWRDAEGRLIWGVNDFDEAYSMSYANDLVRLAVSAHLAAEAGHLALKEKSICDSILDGYTCALRERGQPYVLDEQHTWLRLIAEGELRDPVRFWARMNALPTIRSEVPLSAIEGIEHLMPSRNISYRLVRRIAGLGSLGHARFVALAGWCGGPIAREAKALVPSACHWAQDKKSSAEIFYQTIISRAVRCADPFVQLRGRWIVRRLAPHCSRIELATIRPAAGELRLLHAMGWETANVHLATRGARKTILRHSAKQKGKWLHEATDVMLKTLRSDWQTWQKEGYS